MLQQMINGGIAVSTRPSVSTFEEHEQNNLNWALIYTVIGAVINAVLSAIRSALFPPSIDPAQADRLRELGIDPATVGSQPGLLGGIIGALIFSIIGFFIYYGLVYVLGRAFGGTGQFGELAYDISLFAVPFGVITSLLNFIPYLGGVAAFVLSLYSLYLTYLGIQSGMNLPQRQALYVMLIIFAIGLIFACIAALIFGVAIAAFLGGSSVPAP